MPPSRLRASFRIVAASGLFLLPFLLLSCAPKPPSLLRGTYSGGTPHYYVEFDRLGRKHGLERWWHENGTPKYEATWRAGVRDGDYRAWYPDGKSWYTGRDSMGHPSDTLRFWHPNGRLRSLTVFAAGAPAWLEEYDTLGLTPGQASRRAAEAEALEAEALHADPPAAEARTRERALEEWSLRVRATVETWWKLPAPLLKVPRRATARLRVARDGTLLSVTWTEKSGSDAFDARAARALAKVKRLPPLPSEVEAPLDLAYAFTTPGVGGARRRLQAGRELSGRHDGTERDDGTAVRQ